MTKKFLEITFEQSKKDETNGIPIEIIRLKVPTNEEAHQLYKKIPIEVRAKKHNAKIHTCTHENQTRRNCKLDTISTVK